MAGAAILLGEAMGYCDIDDVRSLLSAHGVTAFLDDDQSLAIDGPEGTYGTDAIERAAALKIDIYLDERYPDRTGWASNDWAKWANAVYAAIDICQRRGLVPPDAMVTMAGEITDQVQMIRKGKIRVPGIAEQAHPGPMVSNYDVERYRAMPVRVDERTSTGPAADRLRKRWPASTPRGTE